MVLRLIWHLRHYEIHQVKLIETSFMTAHLKTLKFIPVWCHILCETNSKKYRLKSDKINFFHVSTQDINRCQVKPSCPLPNIYLALILVTVLNVECNCLSIIKTFICWIIKSSVLSTFVVLQQIHYGQKYRATLPLLQIQVLSLLLLQVTAKQSAFIC